MGRKMLWMFTVAVLFGLGGCASADRHTSKVGVYTATGEAVLEPEGGILVGGKPWDYALEATGEGLASPGAGSPIERKLSAIEAAKCRAMAKLVERLGGLRVARESKVVNMQFAGESVRTAAEGDLRGVRVVESEYDENSGLAQVTLQLGLDGEGNVVPESSWPPSPVSLEARRARAEHAARVDALAKLREQIGKIRVGQSITVKNLLLEHQESWLEMEGILKGVEFEPPQWVGYDKCTVRATVKVTPSELEELEAAAGSAS